MSTKKPVGKTVKYIKANKSAFVKLLRTHGYKPTVHRAKLEKAFRARTWWLSWKQPEGEYEASLSSAGGRPFVRILGPDRDTIIPLHIAELEELGMVEMRTV